MNGSRISGSAVSSQISLTKGRNRPAACSRTSSQGRCPVRNRAEASDVSRHASASTCCMSMGGGAEAFSDAQRSSASASSAASLGIPRETGASYSDSQQRASAATASDSKAVRRIACPGRRRSSGSSAQHSSAATSGHRLREPEAWSGRKIQRRIHSPMTDICTPPAFFSLSHIFHGVAKEIHGSSSYRFNKLPL